MARLTPEEAQFVASLRRMLSRGGSLATNLLDPELTPPPEAKSVVNSKVTAIEPIGGYWNGVGSTSFSGTYNGEWPEVEFSQLLLEANKLPGPPRGRGVSLSRVDGSLAVGLGNNNYSIYADIEFGIGSSIQRLSCDWKNSIVNIPGSVVRITARWAKTDPSLPYYNGNQTGNLTAAVCTDPLVSKGLNTYTQYLNLNGPTVNALDIPPFAIGFWLPINPASVFTSANYVYVANVQASEIGNTVAPYIGQVASSAIQANGLTNLTSLPSSASSLVFNSSGITVAIAPKIIWAIQV